MIYCSGIGGIKLLGVPSIPHLSEDPTGSLIANATITLLEEWKCRSSVIGMVFDTTSSNTRHKTKACIAIQRELDSPLLWLACGHHVGEVVLSNVWDAFNVEVSSSPNVTIFTRLKSKWSQLSFTDTSQLSYPTIDAELVTTSNEIINLCQTLLTKDFIKCDYK